MDEDLDNSFLSKTSLLNYDSYPRKNFLISLALPCIVTAVWFAIPLDAHSYALYATIWYPIFLSFHCACFWVFYGIFLPLPPRKIQFLTSFGTVIGIAVLQLIFFWIWKGVPFVLKISVNPTFVVASVAILAVCFTQMRHVITNDNENDKVEGINNEEDPLLQNRSTKTIFILSAKDFIKGIIYTKPSAPFFRLSAEDLPKEYLCFCGGALIVFTYYIYLLVFFDFVWFDITESWVYAPAVILFFMSGNLFRKLIFFTIEKLQPTVHTEFPMDLLFGVWLEFLFCAFARTLFWITGTGTFVTFLFCEALEDVVRGLILLHSEKFSSIIYMKQLIGEGSPEEKKTAVVHYILRKQIQVVTTISISLTNIILIAENLPAIFGLKIFDVAHLFTFLSILLIFDLILGAITLFFASKAGLNFLDLIDRFYSYPNVLPFMVCTAICSVQLVYIANVDVLGLL